MMGQSDFHFLHDASDFLKIVNTSYFYGKRIFVAVVVVFWVFFFFFFFFFFSPPPWLMEIPGRGGE